MSTIPSHLRVVQPSQRAQPAPSRPTWFHEGPVEVQRLSLVHETSGRALPFDEARRAFGRPYESNPPLKRGCWEFFGSLEDLSALDRTTFVDPITNARIDYRRFEALFGEDVDPRELGPGAAPTSSASASLPDAYTTEALLSDYLAARKTRGRSEGTLDFIKKHSKALLRLLPKHAGDITHEVLLDYIAKRDAQGAGEVIRKEVHSVLRPALKQAYKSERFDRDPAKVVPEMDNRSQPRERWLSPQEVWGIALFFIGKGMAHRAALMAYAIALGAELVAWNRARRGDVRSDYHGARVHGSKNKRRDRFAPTPMPEQRALLRWAVANADGGPDGALFSRWTNACRDLAEACDALGIPSCSSNDLRRSYATWLGHVGIRDELIAKAMGHAPKTMVEKHYRKLSDDDVLRLMEEEYARSSSQVAPSVPEVPASLTGGSGHGEEVPRDGIEPPTRGFSIRSAGSTVAEALADALRGAAAAGQWTLTQELLAELRAWRETGGAR